MNDIYSRHAFVLGCERSGSTWLSNVLDAHSDVEFYMEPFADYANLFPGLAGRNIYMDHCSNGVANILVEGYKRLPCNKYLFFYSRERSLYWKSIDSFIANLLVRIGRWKHLKILSRTNQFNLLNLNLKNVPIKWQVKKNGPFEVVVTKELRLNFKVGLIRKIFPQAKYIIIVRHPGAQVASILRLFKRGNLSELRKSLHSLYEHLNASDRFEKYSNYYQCFDVGCDVKGMLLLWWLINYETVIGDCRRFGVDYKVVYSEDLSEDTESEYRKIFSFLGLDFTQDVKNYIAYSTVEAVGNVKADSLPLDTIRDSSRYSKESISNIDKEMKIGVSSLFENFDVYDELSRYWEVK